MKGIPDSEFPWFSYCFIYPKLEAEESESKKIPKKSLPRQNTVKLLETKDKMKIFKAAGKWHLNLEEVDNSNDSRFLIRNHRDHKEVAHFF